MEERDDDIITLLSATGEEIEFVEIAKNHFYVIQPSQRFRQYGL